MILKVTLLKWRYWKGTGLSLCSISQEKAIIITICRQEDANIAIRVEKNNLMAILKYSSTQCKIVYCLATTEHYNVHQLSRRRRRSW